jgi:uncharacterized protein (TIGR03435 family)
MLRKLLIDQFGMTFHNEERPVITTFILTATTPKLQKADPSNRTGFHEGPGADGKDPRLANPALGRLVTCQNMTMAQFAAKLPLIAAGYVRNAKIIDGTGMEGAFDFTLAFSNGAVGTIVAGGVRDADPATDRGPAAMDPPAAVTLFEALEKQLGLQLKQTKRPGRAMVIDRIDEKPKEP